MSRAICLLALTAWLHVTVFGQEPFGVYSEEDAGGDAMEQPLDAHDIEQIEGAVEQMAEQFKAQLRARQHMVERASPGLEAVREKQTRMQQVRTLTTG